MPTPKIKDAELRAVLAALETDLTTAFEAAKPGLLAKAVDGSDKPPSESTDDSASPPADDGSAGAPPSAPPASPSPSPAPDASAAPASAPAASPAPAGAPAGDPGAEASLTPEALQAEYSQLSPEELDMHLQAAMAAKQALAASAAPAPGAGAMPPAASPAPASPAGGMPPPALKAEMGATGTGGTPSTHAKANGGQEKEVKKSEDSEWKSVAQALQAQVAGLQKNLDETRTASAAQEKTYAEDVQNLTKAVTLVLERPERKAITGVSQIEYIRKSEAPAEVKKVYTPADRKSVV